MGSLLPRVPEVLAHCLPYRSLLDPNGDGSIDVEEIGEALRQCEVDVTDDVIQEWIEVIDDDGNLSIEFSEFMGLMVAKSNFFGPKKARESDNQDVIATIKKYVHLALQLMLRTRSNMCGAQAIGDRPPRQDRC